MRRIGVVLGIAALMAATVVLTVGTALAQAESDTSIRSEPFAFIYDNRCTGEALLIEGTFQQVTHTTLNKNGYHVAISSQINNVTGTGLATGIEYRITGTSHTVQSSTSNGIQVSNDGTTEVVVSKDGSPNSVVQLLFKSTVDETDGQPSVGVEVVSFRCTPEGETA